jgi:hypothetical protein
MPQLIAWSRASAGSWLKVSVRRFDFRTVANLSSAATVSIRYATVRRQGEIDANGLETQIIQYPSVYIRLLPTLSHAYVFTQIGQTLVCPHEMS